MSEPRKMKTWKRVEGSSMEDSLDLAEKLILYLLYANNRSPIAGKTMLIKQVFIIAMEIEPKIGPVLEFYPYQIGPYSTVLAKMLNFWIREGIVDASMESRDWIFSLTQKGTQRVTEFLDMIDEKTRQEIEQIKGTTVEWGTKGILSYVYKHYPEYAITSRIRGEIFNS
jgi:uncharacterized protein YwgA